MKGDSDKYRLTDNGNTNNHLKTDQIHNNYNIIDDKKKQQDRDDYLAFDVAIVGAGFAGLSAALLLGRYLRPTVIFDGGETRNHASKHVHGYLGFENSSPKHIIQKAWKDRQGPHLHGWVYDLHDGVINPVFEMEAGTHIDELYEFDNL